MSNKIKKFLNEYWPLLVVVLVTIPILFVACFNKNVYNVDESLSYSLSNYDMGWMNYPMNGICTRYVMDGYKVTNNPFNFEMVWHWQALDEHPPLYYAV